MITFGDYHKNQGIKIESNGRSISIRATFEQTANAPYHGAYIHDTLPLADFLRGLGVTVEDCFAALTGPDSPIVLDCPVEWRKAIDDAIREKRLTWKAVEEEG